ncbi:MAG TPA: pilus assembly protein N-terminal domain-containing protein [Gemmatimonadaceae bacterium]|nr:pilus assembly protein N-terminal domain-containing protein [Gemmatimonadaceae bacterium]
MINSLVNTQFFVEVRLKALAMIRRLSLAAGFALAASLPGQAAAQSGPVIRIDLPVGRSYPLTTPVGITKVSIANPDVADVVVIGTRELVINSKLNGETDAIFWLANGTRLHYRVSVHSAADRQQIALYIKIAEVRKDFSRQYGLSGLYRNRGTRVGTGTFRTDDNFNDDGSIALPDAGFLTVLTDFGTKHLLALLDLQEQTGKAKTLAEPNLLAGNKDTATFLAGGEIPVPVVQPGDGGTTRITIQYKEFGVRLRFLAEILSDSLVKLNVTPEVSSLDFVNGIELSGFRIPAFRTRRVSTTVDVRRDQSMIISGLFNNEQEKIKSGIPLLKDIPIIGDLFSSSSWKNNESELLVIVTPVIVDPLDPRPQDVLKLLPDTALPARDAIKKRLDDAAKRPPSPIIR